MQPTSSNQRTHRNGHRIGPVERAGRVPAPFTYRLARAAIALALLVACRADAPTEPTGLPTPTVPAYLLTGGAGTPIFPLRSVSAPPQPMGFAIGLNNAGQVTGGEQYLGGSIDEEGRAFLWTPGVGAVMIGGTFGVDVNDAGVVVGTDASDASRNARAFVRWADRLTLLPILPGAVTESGRGANAIAINDAGQIVGVSIASTDYVQPPRIHAVLWSASGDIHDLGTLGGSNSRAADINNAGQVIGMSQTAGDAEYHAFLWSSATGMQDLDELTGQAISDVFEINDAGQIIGAGAGGGFLFTPGSGLRHLPLLPTGLNNRGEVVGLASSGAVLWTPTEGIEDITALTGVREVRRLNDRLQTLTGTAPTDWYYYHYDAQTQPRLVQLQITQSNAPPTALFTVSCSGLTCTFDATGSLDDKPGLAYAWNLDRVPGGAATGVIATTTYPHAGDRTVRLTVTDPGGLTSTISQTFAVSTEPVVAFAARCSGLTCVFDSGMSTGVSEDFLHDWWFGDGSAITDLSPDVYIAPSHTYAQAGTYDVTLRLAGVWVTQKVSVGLIPDQPPVASFTVRCAELTCTFDATGSADDQGIASYAWNLDKYPGGTATGASVTTVYPHTGPRHVTLTVTDASGQTSSTMRQVDVGETGDASPTASFTWWCAGLTCLLDAFPSTSDAGIVSYAWNLDRYPNGSASGIRVAASYPHAGPRNVTLTVTDTRGQTSSLEQTLVIP